MENTLLGCILAKFRSISNFARVIGWDRKKASRIANRVQLPNATDMYEMAKVLDIHDPDTFVRVFLPNAPIYWEKNSEE